MFSSNIIILERCSIYQLEIYDIYRIVLILYKIYAHYTIENFKKLFKIYSLIQKNKFNLKLSLCYWFDKIISKVEKKPILLLKISYTIFFVIHCNYCFA